MLDVLTAALKRIRKPIKEKKNFKGSRSAKKKKRKEGEQKADNKNDAP